MLFIEKKGFLDYQISFSHNRKICILPKSISIKLVSISIGKSSILIENTTFFFIDFYRLISEIDINSRSISITIDTYGMLSSPLGNRRPNRPSAQHYTIRWWGFPGFHSWDISEDTWIHIISEAELPQLSGDVIGPMLVSFPPEIWN